MMLPQQNVINNATSGKYDDVGVLVDEHELTNATMNMSMTMLPKVAQAFSHVVPIGVCHNRTRPYVEQQYQYPVCPFTLGRNNDVPPLMACL
jgi:hypothetical protein